MPNKFATKPAKKFIATLPPFAPLDDRAVDLLEIEASFKELEMSWTQFHESQFSDWVMEEYEFDIFDQADVRRERRANHRFNLYSNDPWLYYDDYMDDDWEMMHCEPDYDWYGESDYMCDDDYLDDSSYYGDDWFEDWGDSVYDHLSAYDEFRQLMSRMTLKGLTREERKELEALYR